MSEKKGLENKLKRLEQIVELIENENTSLDEAIKLYSEAAELAGECNKALREAELTLREIKIDNGDVDNV